jgi:hypothetical protein
MPPKKNISKCIVEDCNGIYHANGICRIHYNRLRKTGRLYLIPKDAKEKLMLYSKQNKETGCREFQKRSRQGYGIIWINGKHSQAHRLSWRISTGKEIPIDKQINHKCHNRCCINPDHLYLGTHLENMTDMKLANRSTRGSKSKNAKLNEEKVIKIKALLRDKVKQLDIAKQYNISTSNVSAINMKEIWGHIV